MSEQVTDRTAEVIRDLALEVAAPSRLEPGNVYGWLSNGQVHKIDLTGDAYRELPERKKGTVTVRDVASFAQYYEKHSDSGSDVFADLDAATFTAVLDAHEGIADSGSDGARWQQHRLVLQLQQTLPWRTWLKMDRQMLTQQQFAEFLEDNCRDLAPDGPVSAADLLEVAQSFQAKTSVRFSKGTRLATGQTQLTYVEDVTASAGQRGEIVIPSEFALAIVPYEDCPPALVPARFRYRLDGGDLRLGYFLADPARIAREAVAQIGEKVAHECTVMVMQGRPA
jgi:uncharacterized protein YfdQ (DUF2303 family)